MILLINILFNPDPKLSMRYKAGVKLKSLFPKTILKLQDQNIHLLIFVSETKYLYHR